MTGSRMKRTRKQPRMGTGRLLRACVVTLALLAAVASARPALAQANFDRPGGDYLSAPVTSGDPADCALVCERDRRCRAWTFSYPTDMTNRAVCWLKSNVPARVARAIAASPACAAPAWSSRATVPIETSIDRFGGDYKNFDLKSGDGDDACKAACAADNKCRAWTYARPGYAGKEAHCFLKKDIKPPRRKAGFTRAWCGRAHVAKSSWVGQAPRIVGVTSMMDFLRSPARRDCIRRQHRDLRPQRFHRAPSLVIRRRKIRAGIGPHDHARRHRRNPSGA